MFPSTSEHKLAAILAGVAVACTSAQHPTARELHDAVVRGEVATVERLIEEGAPLNPECDDSLTGEPLPLEGAVYLSDLVLVELLIERGADPSGSSCTGFGYRSPLQTAVINNYLEMTRYLLARGAGVNTQGENGSTALWDAVRLHSRVPRRIPASFGGGIEDRDRFAIVRLLIESGADPTLQNRGQSEGECLASPLHYAAFNLDIEMATYLLANGADLNARGIEGQTPLECALDRREMGLFLSESKEWPAIDEMIEFLKTESRAGTSTE